MILKPPKGAMLNRGSNYARGLVGCWLMNEGGGTIVNDLSGNGGTTDEVNGFNWSSGLHGPCLNRAGDNDQEIELPNEYDPLDGSSEFTVRVICRCAVPTATDNVLFATETKSTNDPLTIWINSDSTYTVGVVIYASGGTTGVDYGGIVVSEGVWYDIILTWRSGEDARLFINGVEDTAFDGSGASGTLNYTASQYHIGNDDGRNFSFEGDIDSCMLYNRALSATEILNLYRSPFCMFEVDL